MSEHLKSGRRIGFDYGDKRIGVATTDFGSILVSPHATILNDEKLLVKLTEIFNELEPVYVVIGNPRHLSGVNSSKSNEANEFANLIRSIFSGPIYLVDERFSTTKAYSQMRDAGKSERESKSVIDQIAAVNILESALLSEKAGNLIGELF